ncbi:stealth conserved region 3 domain-containing protein [Demequina aurantiaca]|uniref:stealth conserved region 3 domain-containing protein n=1 Tax=Demequina aurantiaca TaxID=676200 RepID=UPI003D34A3C0
MRIDFLLMTPDAGTGVERSTFSQAELAARSNSVCIVGVFRTLSGPYFEPPTGARLKYLLDARGAADSPKVSRLVPPEWDDTHTADSDRELASYLRGTKADIVVTSTPALAALAVEFVPDGVRVIHVEHCASANRGTSLSPLLSHGARLDLLVSQTEDDAQWLQARIGAAAPPTQVMQRVSSSGFRPRSTLENRLVIAGGRLDDSKRLTQLIKAFQTASELVPGWRLRIFGDGPKAGDARYAIWRSGLAGMVDVIPATSRMAAELSKASIFASMSNSGGVPMLGLEAAAAGVPMVAYDTTSGPAEHIVKSGGGLLVPDDEPVGFGVALAHLMVEPAELKKYAGLARVGAESSTSEDIAGRWEEIYRAVRRGVPVSLPEEMPDAQATERDGGVPDANPGGRWLGVTSARPGADRLPHRTAADRLREIFQERGLVYVCIADSANAPRFGLDEASGPAVIDSLETLFSELALAGVAQRGDAVLHVGPWEEPLARPATIGFANVIRVVTPGEDPADRDSVIEVDLWRSDGDGTRFAPRLNQIAEWVDRAAWERWVSSGAATPSGKRAWNQADFPVDAVFTWVDGADPEWDARRRARLASDSVAAALDEDHDAVSSARFVSRDEIYYSVSGVRAFLPWVRDIYIVTDGQVHARVAKDFPDVKFVSHREIFPDPKVLPVFNSRAIESCIHRIPGLAEHFIYFNDDVMVAKPLAVDSFFQANGVARFFPSRLNVNHGANSDAPHLQAAGNNRELILKEFGFENTNTMLHTPHPHVKSVLAELEERYPEEFAVTRGSGFRSPRDLSTLSSLAQYYGWATGRYSTGSLSYRFLRLNGTLLRYRMTSILEDQDVEIVALGEARPEDPLHQDERGIVEEFLEALIGSRTAAE